MNAACNFLRSEADHECATDGLSLGFHILTGDPRVVEQDRQFDPVARNAAAVGLFGTQAEDLGSALFALDLSTAAGQLNGVTGSSQKMFDTLADNDASKTEGAPCGASRSQATR